MEIDWLGHSAVRIRSGDTTVITDPYADSLGMTMPRHKADIVTVSHDHPHHAQISAVDGAPRVLDGPGEFEVADFFISGMGTRRDSPDAPRQINTVYTLHAEGLTVCHLGDLNHRLTPGQAQEINETDVLLVPGGEVCTIGIERVAELVNLIHPRVMVPIHYKTQGVTVELGGLDPLLSELGVTGVGAQRRLVVSATTLPRELEVVALEAPV
jgi:L-ascorbate metabolism protein UlaG (beta-lactamase superfamily)